MSKTPFSLPILQHVFHPSDFSAASETAFAHALKAALSAKATLTIFHVSPDRNENWTEFPGVRQTLERWGILPKNSPRTAVPELGSNKPLQLAILNATIELWSSSYTQANGTGAIDPTAWTKSVEFMRTLPESNIPSNLTVDQLVTEDLLP